MNVLVVVAPTVKEEAREALHVALHYYLGAAPHAYEVCEVPEGGDITEAVARRFRAGFDCVAAAGGDGTVSAVAHVLLGSGVPLAIVPAGTGNLVARELGIPLDIESSVGLLAGTWRERKIDAMRIGARTYLLNAGVGVNAEVIDQTSRLGKSLFGRSAYVGTAVWQVLQAKSQRLEITVDDTAGVYEATDVLISNCGGLARVLHPNGPDIQMDDGVVDVCIMCMKTPLEYPWYYLLKWIKPKHVNRVIHEVSASRRVRVACERPIAVQADGDIIGVTPVEIEVLPNALAVVVGLA